MKKKLLSKTESVKEHDATSVTREQHTSKGEGLTYDNIFDAVDETKATFLKENSDLLIVIRDILAANKISSSAEHKFCLERIEQLWGAIPGTALGQELNKLADIVCKYEEQFFS